jgi:hypothetical protein
MTPLRNSSETRLGIAIRAFMQSARFHTTARFITEPRKTAII